MDDLFSVLKPVADQFSSFLQTLLGDPLDLPEIGVAVAVAMVLLVVLAIVWKLVRTKYPTASEVTQGTFKYWTFISYSRQDEAWGRWLHKKIESYHVPRKVIGMAGRDGPVPKRLLPVFRDIEELPASADLSDQITTGLRESASLIVICSPQSAKSKWVNQEVVTYKKLGRETRTLAIIVDGEPNASDKPGIDPNQECFPPALKFRAGPDGDLTSTRTEPIAADTREQGEGLANARLKVIAGVLGISYDALKRREDARRLRRVVLASCIGASLVGATALYAWQLYDRGWLVALSEPTNSSISVDGVELGSRIKKLPLRSGSYNLSAWAPEHFEVRRSVNVQRRGTTNTDFWLESGFDRELHRSNAIQSGVILVPANDDTILAHNELSRIVFFSTATGRIVADFPTQMGNRRSFQEFDLTGGIGKLIVSGFDAPQDGLEVVAIEASPAPTERWRWKGPPTTFPRPDSMAAIAVPWGTNGSAIVVAGRDGHLYALDARNGQQLSKVQFSVMPLAQPPVLVLGLKNNTPIVTAFFKNTLDEDAAILDLKALPLQAVSLEYPSGNIVWRRDFGANWEGPTPVFHMEGSSHVVIWTGTSWQAIDLITGATGTNGQLPAPPSGMPTFADLSGQGQTDLLFAFRQGDLSLLAVKISDATVRWRSSPLLKPLGGLRGAGNMHLRTSSGELLVDLEDALAAIDPTNGQLSWRFGGRPLGAIIGDWNGDGKNEIIVAMEERGLFSLDEKGQSQWTLRMENSTARPRALIPSRSGDNARQIVMITHASTIALVRGPRMLWRHTAPAVLQASPVVKKGSNGRTMVIATAHVGDGRARLRAIDGAEGGVRWEAGEYIYPNRGPALVRLDGKGAEIVAALGRRPSQEWIHFFAYNPMTGDLVRDVPTAVKGWFSCTPSLADFRGIGQSDVAFSLWDDQSIAMVDGRTGRLVWKHQTEKPNMQGVSVADLDGDGLPDVVAASTDGHVYGLRGTDGTVLWKQPMEGGGWSRPVFAQLDPASAGQILVVSLTGRLYVLDARNGTELWSPNVLGNARIGGHPVVFERDGQTVILAPLGGAGVVAFDWNKRKELWRSPAGFPVIASPVLADSGGAKGGSVVVAALSGDVFVLRAADGKQLWRSRIATGLIEADPVIADLDGDGVADILIAAHDSKLHAINGMAAFGMQR